MDGKQVIMLNNMCLTSSSFSALEPISGTHFKNKKKLYFKTTYIPPIISTKLRDKLEHPMPITLHANGEPLL